MKLRVYRPLRPSNFFCNLQTRMRANTYTTGDDLVFTWNYSVKNGNGSAANELPAGASYDATPPSADGPFKIELMTVADVVKDTITTSDTTITYDNADLITAFGSEPSILKARLTNVKGAYESLSVDLIISKE